MLLHPHLADPVRTLAVPGAGIRRSLLLCFTGELLARLLIATTTSKPFLYLVLYTLLPASASLGVPVMTIAVKRYTPPSSRSLAYGLFYTVMNVAALAGGFVVDALRALVCTADIGPAAESGRGLVMHDSNRLVVLSGALSSGIAVIVTLFLSRAVEVEALEREGAEARGGWMASDGTGSDDGGVFDAAARSSQLIRHELHSQTAGVDTTCAFAHACLACVKRLHSSCPQAT